MKFLIPTLLLALSFETRAQTQKKAPSSRRAPATSTKAASAPASKPPAAKAAEPEETRADGYRWFAGVGHHGATNARFNSASISVDGFGSTPGTATFNITPSFEIRGGIFHAPRDGWGFTGAITYQSKRELTGVDMVFGGGVVQGTYSEKPTIQVTLLEFSGLYRWEEFYLPFGANYSFPQFTAASDDPGSTTMSGGLGLEVGAGWILRDRFVLTALWKGVGLRAKTEVGGITYNYGDGMATGVTLQASYLF